MAARTARRTGTSKPSDDVAETAETAPALNSAVPSFLTTLTESEGVARSGVRETKPIHTLEILRKSLDTGKAYAITIPEDEKQNVLNDMQRGAKFLDCALRKSFTPLGNGQLRVDFQASTEKVQRNYNTADIKTWVLNQFGIEYSKVEVLPKEFRTAYRVAHGYDKMSDEDQQVLAGRIQELVEARTK